jgi:hypothetical protein
MTNRSDFDRNDAGTMTAFARDLKAKTGATDCMVVLAWNKPGQTSDARVGYSGDMVPGDLAEIALDAVTGGKFTPVKRAN